MTSGLCDYMFYGKYCPLHLLTHLGELWYVLAKEVPGDEGPGERAQAVCRKESVKEVIRLQ